MATVLDPVNGRTNNIHGVKLEHSMLGDNRDASFKADTYSQGSVRNEYKHI